MTQTVNLITNPSLETGTTGWSLQSSTIAQSSAQAFSGTQSLLVTLTAAIGAGAFTSFTQAIGTVYTLSAWVYAPVSVSVRAAYSNATVTGGGGTVVLTANTWTRLTVTGTATTTTGFLSILTAVAPTGGSLLYIDGAQAIASAAVVPYGDPSTSSFWTWTGTAHASTSILWTPVIALTQFVDQNPGIRVQAVITDFPPVVVTANITRVNDGRTFKVRGGVNLFAVGGANIIDYEAPIGVPAVYRAEMLDVNGLSLGFTNSATTTIAASSLPSTAHAVISQPLKPVLNVTTYLADDTSDVVVNPIPGNLYYPEGGTVGIWVGGQRHGIQGMKLTVVAQNFTDADEIRSMFGGYTSDFPSVVCVRTIPPVRLPRVFFAAVGEVHESVDYVNSRVIFQLVVDEVAPPSPGLIIPALRREDIDAAYATRALRAAAYASRILRDSDYSKAGLAGP